MTEEIIRCDVCKKVKGEGNKWLKVSAGIDHFVVGKTFMDITNDKQEILPTEDKDICSDLCLKEELGKVLERIRK